MNKKYYQYDIKIIRFDNLHTRQGFAWPPLLSPNALTLSALQKGNSPAAGNRFSGYH